MEQAAVAKGKVMERDEIDATNPLFEKIMAWLWMVTDKKRDLEKQLPFYFSRPTGAVHNPDLHLDNKDDTVWRYGRDADGPCWTQLVRQEMKPLSPYRSTKMRLSAGSTQANALDHQLVFMKHSSACLQEDWCWEMTSDVATPLSRLQVNLASHTKAIALGDYLLLKRDDITVWLTEYARCDDFRPGQESLIILYKQFCPGLEIDDQEMQLFYPESVQKALSTALNRLVLLQHRG